MSFSSLLNTTVDVYTNAPVSDATGMFFNRETIKYSNVRARLQPMPGNADYGMTYGTERIECTHKLFIQSSYDVTEDDIIHYGSTTYLTVAVNDIDYMNHHKEIWLKVQKPNLTS